MVGKQEVIPITYDKSINPHVTRNPQRKYRPPKAQNDLASKIQVRQISTTDNYIVNRHVYSVFGFNGYRDSQGTSRRAERDWGLTFKGIKSQ